MVPHSMEPEGSLDGKRVAECITGPRIHICRSFEESGFCGGSDECEVNRNSPPNMLVSQINSTGTHPLQSNSLEAEPNRNFARAPLSQREVRFNVTVLSENGSNCSKGSVPHAASRRALLRRMAVVGC